MEKDKGLPHLPPGLHLDIQEKEKVRDDTNILKAKEQHGGSAHLGNFIAGRWENLFFTR